MHCSAQIAKINGIWQLEFIFPVHIMDSHRIFKDGWHPGHRQISPADFKWTTSDFTTRPNLVYIYPFHTVITRFTHPNIAPVRDCSLLSAGSPSLPFLSLRTAGLTQLICISTDFSKCPYEPRTSKAPLKTKHDAHPIHCRPHLCVSFPPTQRVSIHCLSAARNRHWSEFGVELKL